MRTKTWLELGIRRIEKLREYIKTHGYGIFEADLDELTTLLKNAEVAVLEDKATPKELIDVARKYRITTRRRPNSSDLQTPRYRVS